ncbi:MAG TPA: glycosyltransferase family 4 protein [Methylomirabilota bacterium]|nr:glycosyltransferase family 4 protein [Methylomirabilota bacterium]
MFLLDSAPSTWTSQEDRHLRLCQALIRKEVQPILVFSRPLRPDIESRLRSSGAEIEAIDYGEGIAHYWRSLRRLAKKFSVSTAHIIFFDYFSAVPWIARLCGIPVVIYEMQNSGEFRATSWKRWFLRLRTKIMTSPVVKVIAISEFVKGQLLAAGVKEAKIVVRYLGVDTERFVPNDRARAEWAEQFSIGSDEVIVSTVSYLRPFKNPHVLVEACKQLRERSVRVRLLVAGDGEMLADLKTLAKRLGVEDRVHWLGNVSDPRTLLQATDIFVLASVGEAFGLVLAEAMACGVPVVGSRSGSLSEVVEEGGTGLLVPPRDAVAFAEAVEQLSRDALRRRAMGARSVERVRVHFSVDVTVERTIGIYASCGAVAT